MRTRESPHLPYFFLMWTRSFSSSIRSSAKSCLPANQVLCQSRKIPVRNPVGRTFCPMSRPSNANAPRQAETKGFRLDGDRGKHAGLRHRLLQVGHADANVTVAALDRVGRA